MVKHLTTYKQLMDTEGTENLKQLRKYGIFLKTHILCSDTFLPSTFFYSEILNLTENVL